MKGYMGKYFLLVNDLFKKIDDASKNKVINFVIQFHF